MHTRQCALEVGGMHERGNKSIIRSIIKSNYWESSDHYVTRISGATYDQSVFHGRNETNFGLPRKRNVWVPSTTRRRRITSQKRRRWKKMDICDLRPSAIGWPQSGGDQRRSRRAERKRFNHEIERDEEKNLRERRWADFNKKKLWVV